MDDPFRRLQFETIRAQFVFYGYRKADGTVGRAYTKQAHSLREAMADLAANTDVDAHKGYTVRDVFVEVEDGEPTIHVELAEGATSVLPPAE